MEGRPIVVVDDDPLVLDAIATSLTLQGYDVITAENGREALTCMEAQRPSLVLMDLHMPGMTGIDAIRQIIGFAPLTRILVLTISDQDDDVLDAILAGACGYLLKDASVDELIRCIGAAAVGESLVSAQFNQVKSRTLLPDEEHSEQEAACRRGQQRL